MKNVVTQVSRCKMQEFLTGTQNSVWLLDGYSLVAPWLLVHAAFHN